MKKIFPFSNKKPESRQKSDFSQKKITVVTNLILLVVLAVVLAVSFLPEKIAPIYGGEAVSPIYNGNKKNADVSLMFNVYEGTDIVNGILDVLKEKDVKATFFIGGCWADDNGETLKRICEEGHELGNHGYFHKDHKKLGYKENKEEIETAGQVIYALSGVKPALFAPPSGSFSAVTLDCCSDLEYKLIMWSKDTIDWRDKDAEKVYSRATRNPENGDLILMHPKRHTLSALDKIIDFYVNQGFNIVTVGENISE